MKSASATILCLALALKRVRVQSRSWESLRAHVIARSLAVQVGEEQRRVDDGSFQPEMDLQMRPVGHWGPVTATLDWCEVRPSLQLYYASGIRHSFVRFQANYQFSHYVAEISNTFSNIFFVCISLYGARLSSRESLPTRYLVGFAVRLFFSRFSLKQPLALFVVAIC